MIKRNVKTISFWLISILSLFFFSSSPALADSHPHMPAYSITINGAVRQILQVYPETLNHLDSVKLQCNDISRDGSYRGIFAYRGASLQAIIELAGLKKSDASFKKLVDLAFVIRNRSGESTVLSWGEIFYQQPGNIIIADSGQPLQPGHPDCNRCHEESVYGPRLAPLQRALSYPKLVIASDNRANRCLEGISEIKVIELPAHPGNRKLKPLFAPELKIFGAVKQPLQLSQLPVKPTRRETRVFPVGDGRLYHGSGENHFRGVGLDDLLRQAGVDEKNLNTVLLVWAPDGYRSLFSLGEIMLGRNARQILVADTRNGKELEDGGRFKLVAPSDLMADRWIKAVAEIKVVTIE